MDSSGCARARADESGKCSCNPDRQWVRNDCVVACDKTTASCVCVVGDLAGCCAIFFLLRLDVIVIQTASSRASSKLESWKGV